MSIETVVHGLASIGNGLIRLYWSCVEGFTAAYRLQFPMYSCGFFDMFWKIYLSVMAFIQLLFRLGIYLVYF